MVIYKCIECNFLTNLKGNYKQHLKTKKHLNNISKSVIPMVMNTNEHKMNTNEHKMNTNEHKRTQVKKKYMCDYCELTFNTLPSKRRHELHYCKNNDNKDKLIKEKNRTIKKLEKQVQKLIEKVGHTTNIQNNIQLNSYGNEDLSHITDNIMNSLIKIPYGMIPKMIEAVHFNDKKPENKNIMLTNKKENKIQIFRNNKWIYKNKDDVINDLIDGKYFIMETFYDKNASNFTGSTTTNYEKFKETFSANKEVKDTIKSECENVMLNNR